MPVFKTLNLIIAALVLILVGSGKKMVKFLSKRFNQVE